MSRKTYHFPESAPEVRISQAVVYRFVWPDSYGWVNFSICDTTGEFSILSDWGNWSHRWNPKHLGGGQTLTEFLARGSYDYIANKLSYESPSLKDVYDKDATLREFQRTIIDRRVQGSYGKEQAREMWEYVEKFCEEMELYGPNEFLCGHGAHDEVFEEFSDIHEYIRYCKPTVYRILCDELLPSLVKYLRESVLPGSVAPKELTSQS